MRKKIWNLRERKANEPLNAKKQVLGRKEAQFCLEMLEGFVCLKVLEKILTFR